MTQQTPPPATESDDQQRKKKDRDRRGILLFLLFLLFSFLCVVCSSQSALQFVDRERILDHMRSIQQADYGPGVPISFSRVDRDRIIEELVGDEEDLQQVPPVLAAGGGVAVAILPKVTPVATPTPTLLPTPTPTPTPEPDSSAPPDAPTPTSPPPTSAPPTSAPPPATTPSPPPPTVAPSPTAPPPTSPPPTSPPPTATPDDGDNGGGNGGGGDTNNPPQASNDTATTNEETPVIIAVLSNDSDSDGTLVPGSVSVVSGPANGSTTVNGTTGEITYTPNPNFFGNDSFTYRVCDDDSDCSTATVNVTVTNVNDPPVAVDDTGTTPENNAITLTVLSNDSDPDSDPLSVISTSSPTSGTVSINPGFTVTYTPTTNFSGVDIFDYTISDGILTDTATVTITVTGINDPPIAVDDSVTTPEDTVITITVLANDSDPESDPLTVISASPPTTGTANINPDDTITYNPPAEFNGDVTFTYTISDGNLTDSATVTVTVTAVNDPPVAVDDTGTTNQDTPLTLTVTSNDSDIDGNLNPASAAPTASPPNGAAAAGPGAGEITYTPDPGFSGTDVFDYQVCDSGVPPPTLCDTATITITVIDTVPTDPTNLRGAPGDNLVSLGWQHTPEADLVGYRVYRDGSFLATTTGVITKYFDTTVSNGNTYVYTVTAIDAGGNESGPTIPSVSVTPNSIITNTNAVTCSGVAVSFPPPDCATAAGGAPDGVAAEITGTGQIDYDFGVGQGIVDGPGFDLVFYEFRDFPPGIFLDFTTIEISSDGSTWFTIFDWDGDNNPSDIAGTNIDDYANDVIPPDDVDDGEKQNEEIDEGDLYVGAGGLQTGIAIDIGPHAPAGEAFHLIRITYPSNGTDAAQIDAIERLN